MPLPLTAAIVKVAMKRTLTSFVGLLCGILLLTTTTESFGQNLAQKTAQAEAVAAQNDAPADDAKTIAQTLAEAFGPDSDTSALLAAAQALTSARPDEASAIAAAAAVFAPDIAANIAAAVASAAPSQAAAVAAAVASVAPSQAAAVAAAVANAVPSQAAAVAGAVASAVPSEAAAVAGAVAAAVPQAAADVAGAVSQAVPSSESATAAAVIAAVPSVDPAAITSAANTGASGADSSGSGPGGFGGAGVNLPSGTSGGGGGGGPTPTPTPTPTPAAGPFWNGATNSWVATNGVGGDGIWTDSPPWNPLETAIFAGQPGVVTLRGDVSAEGGLRFDSGDYIISGYTGITNGEQTGRLLLDGASNTVTTVGADVLATIAADIAGTNGFTKSGAGQLAIGGTSNNLSGTISVDEGGLILADSALLSGADVILAPDTWLNGVGTIHSLQVSAGSTHWAGSGDREFAEPLNGTLNVMGDVTYQNESIFVWSLRDNTNVQGINPITGGYSFSSISIGGDLNLDSGTLFFFNFYDGVDWTNPFWDIAYTGSNGWLLFDVAGDINGTAPLPDPNTWVDSEGKTLAEIRGTDFTFAYNTDETGKIYLNYIYSVE